MSRAPPAWGDVVGKRRHSQTQPPEAGQRQCVAVSSREPERSRSADADLRISVAFFSRTEAGTAGPGDDCRGTRYVNQSETQPMNFTQGSGTCPPGTTMVRPAASAFLQHCLPAYVVTRPSDAGTASNCLSKLCNWVTVEQGNTH